MKSTIETGQYGMAEINEQEAMTTQGGINLFEFVGAVVGLTVGAIINDLQKVINGKPVSMPAGQKVMNSALG